MGTAVSSGGSTGVICTCTLPSPEPNHWCSGSKCVIWNCTPLCPLQTHGPVGPQVWMTCTASTSSPNPQSLGSTISLPLQIVHRCELVLHPFPPPLPLPADPCSSMSTDVICLHTSFLHYLPPLSGYPFTIIVRGSTCVTGPVLRFPSALTPHPPTPQKNPNKKQRYPPDIFGLNVFIDKCD